MGPQQCTQIFRWSSHSAWDPDLSNWFIILKRSLLQELCRWLEWRPLNAVRKGVCHVGLLRASAPWSPMISLDVRIGNNMNALQYNYDIYDLGKEDTIVYSLRLKCYKMLQVWLNRHDHLISRETTTSHCIWLCYPKRTVSTNVQNLSVKTCKECHAPWTVSQPRELLVCLARRPLASRTMWHRAAAKRFAGFPGTAQMTKDDKSVCASESSRWHTKNI